MTRAEFDELTSWEDLQEAMIEVGYYEDLDGDLYTDEESLIDGIAAAARREWRDIRDVQCADLGVLDADADVWVASPDFSYVCSYYDSDFDNIKSSFEVFLVDNEWFDEEEEDEDDIDEAADEPFEDKSNECIEDTTVLAMLFGA